MMNFIAFDDEAFEVNISNKDAIIMATPIDGR
jgi:hypothetical protein